MALWVVRAGRYGENEAYNLEHGVVTAGWDDLEDISTVKDRESLQSLMEETYPDDKITTLRVWTREMWALKERMQAGDLIALPLKTRSAIAIGRIKGPYKFLADGPEGGKQQRSVEWIKTDLARTDIDQDLLYSLGSILTVFQVQRNNAEDRFRQLLKIGGAKPKAAVLLDPAAELPEAAPDLQEIAADQIARHIGQKLKGHPLARIVGGILEAQGYKVRLSPPGADGGVDILAGTGPMGFERPRLAAQVKSGDTPADVSVLRELQGVMPRFGAEQGLIVSWGGFNSSVIREARQLFFEVRLWDAGDLVAALQENYDRLDKSLQAELPLKRIWVLATEDE